MKCSPKEHFKTKKKNGVLLSGGKGKMASLPPCNVCCVGLLSLPVMLCNKMSHAG